MGCAGSKGSSAELTNANISDHFMRRVAEGGAHSERMRSPRSSRGTKDKDSSGTAAEARGSASPRGGGGGNPGALNDKRSSEQGGHRRESSRRAGAGRHSRRSPMVSSSGGGDGSRPLSREPSVRSSAGGGGGGARRRQQQQQQGQATVHGAVTNGSSGVPPSVPEGVPAGPAHYDTVPGEGAMYRASDEPLTMSSALTSSSSGPSTAASGLYQLVPRSLIEEARAASRDVGQSGVAADGDDHDDPGHNYAELPAEMRAGGGGTYASLPAELRVAPPGQYDAMPVEMRYADVPGARSSNPYDGLPAEMKAAQFSSSPYDGLPTEMKAAQMRSEGQYHEVNPADLGGGGGSRAQRHGPASPRRLKKGGSRRRSTRSTTNSRAGYGGGLGGLNSGRAYTGPTFVHLGQAYKVTAKELRLLTRQKATTTQVRLQQIIDDLELERVPTAGGANLGAAAADSGAQIRRAPTMFRLDDDPVFARHWRPDWGRTEAAGFLAGQPAGSFVLRPSKLGPDHCAITYVPKAPGGPSISHCAVRINDAGMYEFVGAPPGNTIDQWPTLLQCMKMHQLLD